MGLGSLLCFLSGCGSGDRAEESSYDYYPFTKEGELAVVDSRADTLARLDIEIADTIDETIVGLMYRQSMESDQGMLFIFDTEQPRSFWMKNTYFSLDIIFVDSEGTIVSIQRETTPLSEASYSSDRPAQYVLEVVGGFTRQHGINAGDRIVWTRTAPSSHR
jgi:hypothetical protein